MKMKIGLLGSGKTGSKVIDILKDREDVELTVFNSKNQPTLESLKELQGVISFLPGNAFLSYIPLLLETDLYVVTGSTGFDWPGGRDEFSSHLKKRQKTWIHGHNFSLGMNLVKEVISLLKNSNQLFDSSEIKSHIHEVHHTKKLDAPSGTAIAWNEWLGMDSKITSEREGDVIGDHKLTLDLPFEKITLRHEAKDRKIFASGAAWAMEGLLTKSIIIDNGLHVFQDVALEKLLKGGHHAHKK